jgi:hypothetical protein
MFGTRQPFRRSRFREPLLKLAQATTLAVVCCSKLDLSFSPSESKRRKRSM